MSAINADVNVMRFFPCTQSQEQTAAFIGRMQEQFVERGFCYFAVDLLETGSFIGFIGLSEQTFVSDFTPCIDIGWRLRSDVWGQGLASEGARRCLHYAFEELHIGPVKAITPQANSPSLRVMEKIGMRHVKHFEHPLLLNDARLRTCVLYEITHEKLL